MSRLPPGARTALYTLPAAWVLLVFVPGRIEGFESGVRTLARTSLHLAGAAAMVVGAALGLWAAVTLARKGEGTPAFFDPPRRLVPGGPYARTRNPLILAFTAMALGEAALRESIAVGLYGLALFAMMALFVVRVEEPGLAQRYGATYAIYCRHVPRFMPRWRLRSVAEDEVAGTRQPPGEAVDDVAAQHVIDRRPP